MVTDGPHGLRKQIAIADHVGLNESAPATSFHTASAPAATWDRDLIYQVGVALGEECRKEKVGVILGPGVNIKRSPLCGRNFEYFSEDPYLTGEMAKSQINGVQSQGIGTSQKHYIVNNQEFRRMVIDAIVDNRALREIYLTGYEIAIKDAQSSTVVCAYNRVKGTCAAEHPYLMTDILKDDKDTATSCLLSFRRRKTRSWVFGDGGVKNVCDDATLVTAPGEYTFMLTVTGLGGNDTKTIAGYISAGSCRVLIPVDLTRP